MDVGGHSWLMAPASAKNSERPTKPGTSARRMFTYLSASEVVGGQGFCQSIA